MLAVPFYVILIFAVQITLTKNRIISPEIPVDFRIKICSHQRHPFKSDIMLYFPEAVKFCASISTNKNKRSLDKDKQKTTFIEPIVKIVFNAINAEYSCDIQYTGYHQEYRFSPDLGFYTSCQHSIAQYISSLVEGKNTLFDVKNPSCPIQKLPQTAQQYQACDLLQHTWYQVSFHSQIRFETFKNRLYHKHSSNYTTSYIFKPDLMVTKSGNESEWLRSLINFNVHQTNCTTVKFLLQLDKDWPIPIVAIFDYKIRDANSLKYIRRIDNGTLIHWYNGEFEMIRDLRSHELCVQNSEKKCIPIDIGICKDIPYNYTFPNPNFSYDTSILHTDHFKPLIRTNCNPHIKFFVCSVFAPMCPVGLPQAVTSCKSVCEEIKRDCIKIFTDFDMQWPEVLDCSKFPEEPDLCMKPNPIEMSYQRTSDYLANTDTIFTKHVPTCPKDLINLDGGNANGSCAGKCHQDLLFNVKNKIDVQYWLFVFGAINVAVTFFTVLTFLIDKKRFRFPERSIFYIAACYMFYSVPYLYQLLYTYDDVACGSTTTGARYLIESGVENKLCVGTFLLTYYFSTAGALWWLALSITWYLSTGRKWVPEGIESCSNYLHLFAWGSSAILTLAVLVGNKVDAFELTGICSVGNSDPFALIGFIIVPKIVVLAGSIFIILGFSSMLGERDLFKQRGTDTSKLDKLLMKMGIYSLMFIGPMTVALACDVYHYYVLQEWFPSTFGCKQYGGAERGGCRRPQKPQYEVYLLGQCMQLIIGISTSIWIFSSKTCSSWKHLICRSKKKDCLIEKSGSKKIIMHNGNNQVFHPLLPNSNPPSIPQNGATTTNSVHYIPCTINSQGSKNGAWGTGKMV
uniref:FZ domain-containing protein n=1 Tax=Rhabditophanes sp. KR3021 TaxID=114890 RepID=A0AC35TPQ7_9BILA